MAGLQSSLPLLLAGLLFFTQAHAVDLNGYTSDFECRNGNTNCDVDVASLGQTDCDQIITTSTSPTGNWSAINWSNDVICIQKGNHEGRGDIPMGSSGSAGNWKVLRYYDPSDTDQDPWDLSSANQAKISGIDPSNRDFWLIHRISMTQPRDSNAVDYLSGNSSNNWIFSRILAEGAGGSGDSGMLYVREADDVTIQNSVLRNCQIQPSRSYRTTYFSNATRFRFVNNEVYNCAKGIATSISGTGSTGNVIENNDFYIEPSFGYTDCSGNFTSSGTCSIVKHLVSIEHPFPSSSALVVTQNRVWGARRCDGNVSCSGGGSAGYAVDGGFDSGGAYQLFQNNIITDSNGGLARGAGPGETNTNITLAGNIIFDTKQFSGNSALPGIAFWGSGGGTASNNEVYMNTVISSVGADGIDITGSNADVECNVLISSNTIDGLGSGGSADYNMFYDTTLYQTGSNSITRNITLRTNSQSLLADVIVKTGDLFDCNTVFDDECYLYKVTTAGTTAGSKPSYCTSANCTTTDGTAVLTAIRGPYQYYRKLRTTPELKVIPYARIYSNAPDKGLCPTGLDNLMRGNSRGISDTEIP